MTFLGMGFTNDQRIMGYGLRIKVPKSSRTGFEIHAAFVHELSRIKKVHRIQDSGSSQYKIMPTGIKIIQPGTLVPGIYKPRSGNMY